MKVEAQERRVWDLLVRNFDWEPPADHPVKIRDPSGERLSCARVQVFELAVTAILAHMRPEFAWCVTPNRRDDGLDFLGVHRFLEDRDLGIAAAITVGGQCKKRTNVNEVVGEIAGSLIRMADAFNPTFFVVALSAPLTRERVENARGILERQALRHCHILDRTQIEGLMADCLGVVTDILRYGLPEPEREEVVAYLEARATAAPPPTVTVSPPPRVLAGVPFRMRVQVRWTLASNPDARLWWRPPADGSDPTTVTLVGPVGADVDSGVKLVSQGAADDPLSASCVLELTTYAVGRVHLGHLSVGLSGSGSDLEHRIDLGEADVVENMRPRFFDEPYRAGLARLEGAYVRVLAGATCSLGVTGAGGSGKSRLCEEFSLEKRRRGCSVVAAKHPKTHEEPLRILADLLTVLAADGPTTGQPADDVLRAVAQYDPALAGRAEPAIRSIFGTRTTASADDTEQDVISAILLLLVACSRRGPAIVHLQDLHWCGADVLSLLERLVRQLSQVPLPAGAAGQAGGGVLFLFEGRVRESGATGSDAWSSAPFEAFLARVESTAVTCSSFTADEGLRFTRLLFESRHNAHRLLADDLLQLQDELVDRVCQAAGGNPFHTLEHVRLFKEMGVVGQNPKTGLLYMVRPAPGGSVLPESVFAAIERRWQYMRSRAPDLALLVWSCALLDDQIAMPLFRHLWRDLAPDVSLRDVDATDMLWTGDGTAHEVGFRHENYFESIRRFTIAEADRRRVVEAYCSWFASLQRPSPAERFGWARAMLELPDADRDRARALLVSALKSSRRSGDPRLSRRILEFYLNLTWELDEGSPIPLPAFLRHCDEERDLCRDLLGIDREQAAKRIGRLRRRVESRVESVGDRIPAEARDRLLRQLLTAEALHAQLLFNDRRPTEAASIAERVIAGVRARRPRSSEESSWEPLEMEALYTLSCAQAISGEYGAAVRSSAAASEIAMRSQSPIARKVVSTYGTMLLSEDPKKGEILLRRCLERWADDDSSDASLLHVHLSMALVLQAYRYPQDSDERRAMLDEARDRMTRVHDSCRRLGLYPDAGAAALVRGVVSALSGEREEAAWFAQAVAAASRGRQMETLWRSHINLAMALYRKEGRVTPSARDHALAGLEIMEDTLKAYSEPERSPRFRMLRVGMAAAAWALLDTGDDRGLAVMERYPALRSHFNDPEAGVLAPYDGSSRHYQWLRVDDVDYALY